MLADADRICSDLAEALRAKVLLAEQIQVLAQQQSDALLLQSATLTAQLTELQRAYQKQKSSHYRLCETCQSECEPKTMPVLIDTGIVFYGLYPR